MTKFDKYINKVSRFYRQNTKYYHTIYHIKTIFKLYEYYEKDFDKEFGEYNKDILCWAIAYHDSFYMPGFVKNEELSAIIAKTELVSITDQNEVERLILNTIPSNNYFPTIEDKIIHDLDWSGFSQWDDFINNQRRILKEAVEVGGYPEDIVKENQYKFYKSIFDKNLYVTKTFSKFNEKAKHNLKECLALIDLKRKDK